MLQEREYGKGAGGYKRARVILPLETSPGPFPPPPANPPQT